jgi:hypothetical protein
MENQKPLQEHLVNAVLHVLYYLFVYLLFIVTLNLWKQATIRLSEQKENKSLNLSGIKTLWPFLSFLKRFLLDFLIDGLIFLSPLIGLGLTAWSFIETEELMVLIMGVIMTYYTSAFLTIFRDCFQISLLPIRKFLNWAGKPAQYMDLEIKNK